MILKYSILAILCTLLITSSDPFYGIMLSWKSTPPPLPGDVKERAWMSTDAFKRYLHDYDERVSNTFKIKPFFYPNVHFWFLIYTQFESTSVVIHDKDNLSLIYKVLDFSSLHTKELPRNTLYVLQNKISGEKVNFLENELEDLSKNPFSMGPSAKRIYRILKNANVKLPERPVDRKSFFLRLKKNIRTQTGQKNFIRDGVIRSLPYQKFLSKYFSDRGLPAELLAIPFLESSFNPRAQSKVNALGVWQFMPLIASYYVPKRTLHFDYRSNVGVASVAAASLLSENLKVMKSWDLAVTAYNSGTRHLLKTKRSLGKNTVSLEDIIRHSDSNHFGFASKNFYSEFLALAHTLAYKDELFDGIHRSEREDIDDHLKFYLSKCSINLEKDLHVRYRDGILYHNHHFIKGKSRISKGTIITTKDDLPKNKFYEVSYRDLLKTKPRDWEKLIRRYSCSTR